MGHRSLVARWTPERVRGDGYQEDADTNLRHVRRVATPYDKRAANSLAMGPTRLMRQWLRGYESTS